MKRKHNQGFSLVELLIAIAILSLIMIALASFMGTTTNSYVRSRNDLELQQTGQEVFDMIADKLMQATEVRIGTTTKEYAMVGTDGSVKVGADYSLLSSMGSPMSTVDGRMRYSFDALTSTAITDTNALTYIAVRYEVAKVDDQGYDVYGDVVDVFYFSGNDIFLFRSLGGVRKSSNGDSPSTNPDLTVSISSCITHARSKVLTALSDSDEMQSLQNENWVCKTLMTNSSGVPAASVYALPDENALYLSMDFFKQNMENSTEGMVTIRSSYVLKPKESPSVTGGSSGSGTI